MDRQEAIENTIKNITRLRRERLEQLDQEIKANIASGKQSYFRGELVDSIQDIANMSMVDSDLLEIIKDKITNTP